MCVHIFPSILMADWIVHTGFLILSMLHCLVLRLCLYVFVGSHFKNGFRADA
jgi:hypothetical protein